MSAGELTTRIRELRAKATHARWLVKSVNDAQTVANLRCYADELDAEASQLELQVSAIPAQAIPGEQPDNGALAALEDALNSKAIGQSD